MENHSGNKIKTVIMKKEDFLEIMSILNINPKHFGTLNDIKSEAYNMEKLANGDIIIYYLEGGKKNGIEIFKNEEDAYVAHLKSIIVNLQYGLDMSQ